MLCYRCGSYTPDGSRDCTVCGQAFAVDRRAKPQPSGVPSPHSRAEPPYLAGTMLANRYRIAAPAGLGTSGWVLRAHDVRTNVDVAIKVIAANLLQTDEDRQRFARALRACRKAHAANLTPIIENGQDGVRVYYVMPFLEGLTLRKVIDLRLEEEAFFGFKELGPLLIQLATGLEGLSRGHGALRPHNIMVLPEHLSITGAPHLAGLPRRPFVVSQTSLQTRDYLAPEARTDGIPVDARADVFALSVMLTEMLSGKVPGRDVDAWDHAHRVLPGPVVAVLRRNVAESPSYRLRNATELVEALERAMHPTPRREGPLADRLVHADADDAWQHQPPAMPLPRPWRGAAAMLQHRQTTRRHQTLILAALLILTGMAISAGLWLERPMPPPSPAQAGTAEADSDS